MMCTLPPTIHLWWLPLAQATDTELAAAEALLAPAESARARQYAHPAAQRCFTLTRAALRVCLQELTGTPARTLNLTQTAQGQPILADQTIAFSVTHAGEWALLAATTQPQTALGIDLVEHSASDPLADLFSTTTWPTLQAAACSPRERAHLQTLAPAAQRATFWRGWCRKEAYLKARGSGLLLPPANVTVPLAPANAWMRLPQPAGHSWWMRDLPALAGYQAALVTSAKRPALAMRCLHRIQ